MDDSFIFLKDRRKGDLKIMAKLIGIFILLFTTKFLAGQETLFVDYSQIKQNIESKKSEFYYPVLLERFNAFDSTLTSKDYMHIYYGFAYQDAYLNMRPDEAILSELLESENFEKLTTECEKILQVNPVSLKANDFLGYALFETGKPEAEWQKYQNRYRAIRRAIASSGDGQSCETALKVIYVSDEYNMLYTYFDVEKIHSRRLVSQSGLCDYFEIEPTQYLQSKEVYFDISVSLLRTQELFDKKATVK